MMVGLPRQSIKYEGCGEGHSIQERRDEEEMNRARSREESSKRPSARRAPRGHQLKDSRKKAYAGPHMRKDFC